MDTHKAANNYRLTQWAQVMKEHAQGNQSTKAFCQERGITPNTYYYWQRKLREAVCREVAVPTITDGETPVGWLKLEPESEAKQLLVTDGAAQRSELWLFANEVWIAVTEETDPDLLSKTLRIIRSAC
jgi:hypothetical protein